LLGEFLAHYGLLAIFAVMLFKETGLPVPVPSDLIMITAGAQAATGTYTLLELLIAIEIAMLVGGSAQFWIARGAGRQFIYRLGRFVGLTAERLDRAMAALQQRGPLAVFVGLNVPGARAGIIPAAGLAGLTYSAFAPAMIGGSSVFYGWHVALGFLAGPAAIALLGNVHLPVLPVLLALAGLGLIGWLILKRRRKASAGPESAALDRLHSWTEAACPACLAITAYQHLRQTDEQEKTEWPQN
ncbi:MAG: DedA family protein, partial [Chloroflexi bacterium]|nr:DedA family protein [Chloroflexota bacterium]